MSTTSTTTLTTIETTNEYGETETVRAARYWDVYAQTWTTMPVASIGNRTLATLDDVSRDLIKAARGEVSRERIERLRSEAAAAGDDDQVADCDRALAGNEYAWRRCCDVVVDALAQA